MWKQNKLENGGARLSENIVRNRSCLEFLGERLNDGPELAYFMPKSFCEIDFFKSVFTVRDKYVIKSFGPG